MRLPFCTCIVGMLSLIAGCTTSKDETPAPRAHGARDDQAPILAQEDALAASRLQWKRHAAFEADLARALELTPASLCLEFGTEPCIRKVHMVPLGGNEPFVTGMLEPAQEPLASTPTVVDRIVLSACANRVGLDQKAGAAAAVFDEFALDGKAPAPTAASTRALITDLYRRLLARDPVTDEVRRVAALARDDAGNPVSATDFAKLACYAVGTSAEFLFF